MTRKLTIWSILTFVAIAAAVAFPWKHGAAAPVPPRANQPNSDVFDVAGYGNLQPLNPVTVKAKAERTANYRLITLQPCVAGDIVQDLAAISAELERAVGFRLVRDDARPDFTVRLNCGTEHIRICNSVNIFCLGRGFPYVSDVEISDIMYSPIVWPRISRLSVLCHEVCGHAIATWNEQYCTGGTYGATHPCYRLAQFTSAPGWRDFMSTGELSRHLFEDIEIERWERTMYVLQDCSLGQPNVDNLRWEPCLERWFAADGSSYEPRTRIWFNARGVAEWGECNLVHRDCWNLIIGRWVFAGSLVYDPATGLFSRPPLP